MVLKMKKLEKPCIYLHFSGKSKEKSTCFHKCFLAEKERFELSNRFTGYTISNRAPSTN